MQGGGLFVQRSISWHTALVAMLMVVAALPAWGQDDSGKGLLKNRTKSTGADSPLLKEPSTPEEVFGVVLLTIDLGRIDLAAAYFKKFVEDNPSDEQLLALRDVHGTSSFLRLSRIKELQPDSLALLERMTIASQARAVSPEFIAGVLDRLAGDAVSRQGAKLELRNLGVRAVPAILSRLNDPAFANDFDVLVLALTSIGRQAIPALVGALDAPSETVRLGAIQTIGWLRATEGLPYLWGPAFSPESPAGIQSAARTAILRVLEDRKTKADEVSSVQAASELSRLGQAYYRSEIRPVREPDGLTSVYGWDEAAGTSVVRRVTPQTAALFYANRFFREALLLSPEIATKQRDYLAGAIAYQVVFEGWNDPLSLAPGTAMNTALSLGPEVVSSALQAGLEAGQPGTIFGALQVLSQIGSREDLRNKKGGKSPVLVALNYPDPRIQFTAATTIMALEPQAEFSGSGRVLEVLKRALTNSGQVRAIVIDADAGRGSETVSFLSQLGYEGQYFATSQAGFREAADTIGVELIVLHANCQRWDLSQAMANFRGDSRTAGIPIVVYGNDQMRATTRRIVQQGRPAIFAEEASSAADFSVQVQSFLEVVKGPTLSEPERANQKREALLWMVEMARMGKPHIFDLRLAETELLELVDDAELGPAAMTALASIGSPVVQSRFKTSLLNPGKEASARQTAGQLLLDHIQRFGLLLSRAEVDEMKAAANTIEAEFHPSVAGFLGLLRPNGQLVGERLRTSVSTSQPAESN